MFELELEGLSPEDREFEVARSVVRLATDTARRAANIAARTPQAAPAQVAKAALTQAATVHAPGLVRSGTAPSASSASLRTRGTWVRQGRRIILYGV
ncbi:MAG: hypothetical protein OHK0039_19490 [Bacteroidia bacterium]